MIALITRFCRSDISQDLYFEKNIAIKGEQDLHIEHAVDSNKDGTTKWSMSLVLTALGMKTGIEEEGEAVEPKNDKHYRVQSRIEKHEKEGEKDTS